jgi:hypothetical protein
MPNVRQIWLNRFSDALGSIREIRSRGRNHAKCEGNQLYLLCHDASFLLTIVLSSASSMLVERVRISQIWKGASESFSLGLSLVRLRLESSQYRKGYLIVSRCLSYYWLGSDSGEFGFVLVLDISLISPGKHLFSLPILLKSQLHLESQPLFRQRVEELGEDDLKAGANLNRQSAIRYLRKVSKHYLYG